MITYCLFGVESKISIYKQNVVDNKKNRCIEFKIIEM